MGKTLAILGAGNLGLAIARGLVRAERYQAGDILLTRRHTQHLEPLAAEGFVVAPDNPAAVSKASTILLAVQPQQLDALLAEIRADVDPERQILISVVSGASIQSIVGQLEKPLPVVRAMPNVAIAVGRSMTCLAVDGDTTRKEEALSTAQNIFDAVGTTLVIDEEQMVPATALCACGVAFFLRAVRAASQGGIEIGFHTEEALSMAAQTALGAAALMLDTGRPVRRTAVSGSSVDILSG